MFGAGAASAVVVPDNSLAYNFKLTRLRVSDENQATVLDTETGQVSGQAVLDAIRSGQVGIGRMSLEGDVQTTIWPLESADRVLVGATVRMQVPLLGFDGQLAESSPGAYTAVLSDTLVLTPDFGTVSEQEARAWQVEPLEYTLNGQQLTKTSLTDYVSDVDLTAGGTYPIPLTLDLRARILDADGQPLANRTLEAEVALPNHSYTEMVTLTTDANGVTTYSRSETASVTVSGGEIVQLAEPVDIEQASTETVHVLDAWEPEPTPTPTPTPDYSRLCVDVHTSKSSYVIGEVVRIYGWTTDCSDNSVEGAGVSFSIRPPEGSMKYPSNVISNENGYYETTVSLQPQDEYPIGTYDVTVNATYDADSDGDIDRDARSSTAFEVKGGALVTLAFKEPYRSIRSFKYSERLYAVYRRGDSMPTEINVDPDPALDPAVEYTVKVELRHHNGNIVDSKTQTLSTEAESVTLDFNFELSPDQIVGHYDAKATLSDPDSTVMDSDTGDAAIVFNPSDALQSRFVEKETAVWGGDSFGETFFLRLTDGRVFEFAMDAAGGEGDEASAASQLKEKTAELVKWVKGDEVPSHVQQPDVRENLLACTPIDHSDCVLGQCQNYANILAAFLRTMGIPGRPVSGGVGEDYVVGTSDTTEDCSAGPDCWHTYHVWTEAYRGATWHVLDAAQCGTEDSQVGYGLNWIDCYCENLYPDFPQRTGGIYAEGLGGGQETLTADYGLSTPCPTPTPTPTATPAPSGQAQGCNLAAEGFSEDSQRLTVAFDADSYPLGQDLVVEAWVGNPEAETWSGDLTLRLLGDATTNLLHSDPVRLETVWQITETFSLDPGASQTLTYTIPPSAYESVGQGDYFVEAQAQGVKATDRAQVEDLLTLTVQAPAELEHGGTFDVVGTVTNAADRDVHDVVVWGLNPGLEERHVAALSAGASETFTWTLTADYPDALSASLLARSADGGDEYAMAVVEVLSPAELRVLELNAPQRVGVGETFELSAFVWNPGSYPLGQVSLTLDNRTPGQVALNGSATQTLDSLPAEGWTHVTWPLTALAPGRYSLRLSVSGGTPGQILPDVPYYHGGVVAEPGHAVDLIVDGVGDDVDDGQVLREAPTSPGTNYAKALYSVVVQNEGTATDTIRLSAMPSAGGMTAFVEEGEEEGEQVRSLVEEVTLASGASVELALELLTWEDEASARVVVRSLGDRTQWDTMLVRLHRQEEQPLQVEPDSVERTIEHGHSDVATLQISNQGSQPLTDVILTPRGDVAPWISLDPPQIETLQPGQTVEVAMTIAVPKYQPPGAYDGSVEVRSGSYSDGVGVRVTVPESHAALVSLTPDGQAVKPGLTALYDVSVQNEGNVTDTFELSLAGLPADWETTLDPARTPTLDPSESAGADLLIIPLRSPETKPATHTFTVTASNPDTSASDRADLEVLVFHDVDVDFEETEVIPGPPIVVTKVWKKAHRQPHGRLDVIVRTHGAPTAGHEEALRGHGAHVKRRFEIVDAIAADIPAANLTEIAAEPFVARVEPDEEVTAVGNPRVDVAALNVDGLHADGFDGAGVVVAVVDTGVDADHPALPNQTAGYDFVNHDADPDDDHGHGTHVAGIVGSHAAGDPGVAPGAALMPVKVLDATGAGLSSDVIAGIEWAVEHGADAVNLSLGTDEPGDGSSALSQATDNAAKSGVVVVVAAGNGGPAYQTVGSPGDAELAITVGALETTTIAGFSSRGPTLDGRVKPDLVAPGVNVSSTWIGGGFATESGTSMASPHVAGVAALLLDAYSITPPLVEEALVTTATPLPDYDSNTQGSGRVDGDAASAYVEEKLSAASTQTLPGDTAIYTYTVTNLGNVDDSFGLAWSADGLPESTLAYPTAISAEWVQPLASPVALASGAQAADAVQLALPADWAGMEATTYRFRLSATSASATLSTSQAEPEVGDTDLAFVSVGATKRSKIEYARLEIGWLGEEVESLPKKSRRGLLAKLDGAEAKVQKALDEIVAGDLIGTNTSLDAAINKMEAFVNEVEAQRGKKLDAATADGLLAEADAIIAHLVDARLTTME